MNINVEELDLYGGVFFGAAITTAKYAGVKVHDYSEVSPLAYSVCGGAKYYFSPNFAVYGEFGVWTTVLQAGASFTF